MDDGLLAIQRAIFLRKAGVETVVDEHFLSSPPTRAELLESAIKNIIRCPSSLVFFCFFVLWLDNYCKIFQLLSLSKMKS